MRRWVCIVVLLVGFSGEGYAWAARPRIPVPIERLVDRSGATEVPRPGWWGLG